MANYQAARALLGQGRNAGEGAAHHGESSTGLSRNGLRSKRPGFQRAAQRRRQEVRSEEAKPKK